MLGYEERGRYVAESTIVDEIIGIDVQQLVVWQVKWIVVVRVVILLGATKSWSARLYFVL
jgi:hypothetical protein